MFMCWDCSGIDLILGERGTWQCTCCILGVACYFRTHILADASPVGARFTFSGSVDLLLFHASVSREVLIINFVLFIHFAGVLSLLAPIVIRVFLEEPKNL